MKRRSLHAWLIELAPVQRALFRATQDATPHQLAKVLSRYMGIAGVVRTALVLVQPIMFALLFCLAGAWWPWMLLPAFAWAMSWRRIMGCEKLALPMDLSTLAKVLLKEGAKPVPSDLPRLKINTSDELQMVVQIFSVSHQAARQAKILDHDTAQAPAQLPSSRPRL